MLRTTTLAIAALLAFAPAANAQEIRIALAGKSQAAIHAEISAAAQTVCRRATQDETFVLQAYTSCTAATLHKAMSDLAEKQAELSKSQTLAQN